MRRNHDAIERWNAIARKCIDFANENPLPNGKRIVLANIYELDPTTAENRIRLRPAPSSVKKAWVNHAGRFDPCCSPDELRQTLGYFGNVQDDGLFAIWQSAEYRDLIVNYLDNDVCRQCNMRQLPG